MTERCDDRAEQPTVHCITHDGVITFVSSTVREASGLAPERFLGRPVLELVHTDDLEALQRFGAPGWEGIIDARFRVQAQDGEWIWLRAEGVRTVEADGHTSAIMTLRQIEPPPVS
jgi:PAS domain S-box-containing protein